MSSPTSNAAFLTAIFGALPIDQTPWACGFDGNPKTVEGPAWRGWPIGRASDAPGLNWYFTLATYRSKRMHANCAAIMGVLADDIGTKAAPRSRLDALPPAALIETSPGNFQALYLFAQPETDFASVEALQKALIVAGMCDPAALSPTTRYCRLPFGVNGKYSPPFVCRLVEWQPERRYTVAQIVAGLGLTLEPPSLPRDAKPAPAWDGLSGAEQAALVGDLRSALECVPLDSYADYIGRGQNLASLGDVGRDLWTEAIRRSEKYIEGDEDRWDGFGGTSSDYRAVFNIATANGWINPRSRAALDPSTVFAMPAMLPPGASLLPPTQPAPPLPFVEVPIGDLANAVHEPQAWWCESYLPAGHVTLFGGHGGVGKSLLALMLAASVATGRAFMGLQTRKGRALFFSAEDPGSMVRRRLQRICRDMGEDPAALAQSLRVLDATETAPALFTEQRLPGGMRGALLTATYGALTKYVEAHSIDVVVVDNASDVFDADEINRAMVRQFVQSLAKLVRARGGAVLLLAHVDKLTSRAGKATGSESYSGSTAWHNSVRSRLFLIETGPGMLELRHEKSNLGPKREPLPIVWLPDSLPRVFENLLPATSADEDLKALLALISEYYERGEYPSTQPNGRPTIANTFKGERSFPSHLKAADVFIILRDGERRKLLARENYRKPNRQEGERFVITATGRAFIAGALSALSV